MLSWWSRVGCVNKGVLGEFRVGQIAGTVSALGWQVQVIKGFAWWWLLRRELVLLGSELGVGCISWIMSFRATSSWHIMLESCWSCPCRLSILWRCWSKSRRHRSEPPSYSPNPGFAQYTYLCMIFRTNFFVTREDTRPLSFAPPARAEGSFVCPANTYKAVLCLPIHILTNKIAMVIWLNQNREIWRVLWAILMKKIIFLHWPNPERQTQCFSAESGFEATCLEWQWASNDKSTINQIQ